MTAQFRWTEADYTSARWAWLKHHPFKLALNFWYPLGILVVAGIDIRSNPANWPIVLLFLFFAIALTVVIVLMQRWTWHRQFKKAPLWHDDVSATIDSQAIQLTGQTFQVVHYWGEFSDVYESGRVIVLEKDKRFIFLPKTGIGPSQIEELRGIISTSARCKVKLASSTA